MNIFSLFRPSEPVHPDALALIEERDDCFRAVINLRAALIDIRNQGIVSKSGTAQAMARKAREALK